VHSFQCPNKYLEYLYRWHDKVRIVLLMLHRFHGETVSFLSEVKQNHLLVVYQVCRFYMTLQNTQQLFVVWPHQIMIAQSISVAVWTFNTETEHWSLIEAKGDIPVSCFLLKDMHWQTQMWIERSSCGAESRQLEVATLWSELVLHWYFLAVRTQRKRNGMTFTCLISSHRHGFHWLISKRSFWRIMSRYRNIFQLIWLLESKIY
jgi:hypothetical protein